jgi:IS5 family transposase
MQPRERRENGEQDLFRSRLDQVINMNHALVKLAGTIDWRFLEEKFSAIYKDGPGQPPLPTRLMAGLAILKHTYKRANRALRTLKTYLGRVIRDVARKIDGNSGLEAAFAHLLSLASRVRAQERGQRGPKVYSLHAPEVECIGKGKAHKPYEFGVKVSVATTLKHSKGGQFVVHAQALPGNPYDGHTLAGVIPAIEQLIGRAIERLHADAGYRGHNAPADYKFKIYTSRQKRWVTPQIKREMRRRSAVEPVIGHLKEDHRMDRNYLAHRHGDFNNAILAAAGYNFRRLIRWFRILLRLFLTALFAPPIILAA